jgi:hypothetical protein
VGSPPRPTAAKDRPGATPLPIQRRRQVVDLDGAQERRRHTETRAGWVTPKTRIFAIRFELREVRLAVVRWCRTTTRTRLTETIRCDLKKRRSNRSLPTWIEV